MKQDQRSIVRKRTQQLVYLELGRDNGGVMLNLSEDGCSFQAITPLKVGETRFAFQISGGRRISGNAEVMWVDDVGIMGGLRFLNLPAEARNQIRLWLDETNAPEEHGTMEPAAAAAAAGFSYDSGTRVPQPQAQASRNSGAEQFASRDYASAPFQGAGRTVEEELPPPPWAQLRASTTPPMQDDRFGSPFLRDDGSMAAPRARSVALWRSLAVLATAVAIALLLVTYQHEVGDSLIWLGETLSGKTKASGVTPESKPAADTSASGSSTPNASSDPGTNVGAAPVTPGNPKSEEASPISVPNAGAPPQNLPSRVDNSGNGAPRQESVLERQTIRGKGSAPDANPEAWDGAETVESLWGEVQAGSIPAERALAERFARGEGVARNCDQAKVLLKAAADRGSREARLRLYELETQGCH